MDNNPSRRNGGCDTHNDAQTICIGVTGHRFLRAIHELVPAIDAVLDQIEARWPGAPLTAISALAEGSDRLVAERVLCRPNARLVVPLPMPEEVYIQDFRLPESAQEFMRLLALSDQVIRFPAALTRPAAYEAAGHFLLAHSDLLIALWDGEPAQGDGGTGSVVAQARLRGLPVFWIHTHNHKPDRASNGPITPQGAVTTENLEKLGWNTQR